MHFYTGSITTQLKCLQTHSQKVVRKKITFETFSYKKGGVHYKVYGNKNPAPSLKTKLATE